MVKIRNKLNDEEKHALLVKQDIQLAKALAGNDSKQRYRVLKNVKKWLAQRSQRMPLTDDDMKRIWKGLFYTMWMSDKPLVQEECAENISKLVHLSTPDESLRFFKFGLTVLAIEWFGIDQIRLEKFLMFTRRLVRQGLHILKNNDWDEELITKFGDVLLETILKEDSKYLALTFHITELFLEELAKVSNGELDEDSLILFLKPFVKFLSCSVDHRMIEHTCQFLFYHLLRQTDEGIEYQQQFEAWRQLGFPGGTIDSMQKLENGDDQEEEEVEGTQPVSVERPLDPRAGKVDVELPQLKFNPQQIVDLLTEFKFAKGSTSKSRKTISKLILKFGKLAEGYYPLGMKKIPTVESDGYSTKVKTSAQRLLEFDEELLSDNPKGKKRKHDEVQLVNGNKHEHKKVNGETEIKKAKNGKQVVNKKTEKKKNKPKEEDNSDFFGRKLLEFINKSEGKISNGVQKPLKKKPKTAVDDNIIITRSSSVKKLMKKKLKPTIGDHYISKFKRSSGTWFVSEHSCDSSGSEFVSSPILTTSPTLKHEKVKILQNIVLKQNNSLDNTSDICTTVKTIQCTISPQLTLPTASPKQNSLTKRSSPIANKSSTPITTTKAKSKKRTSLFSSNAWDLPLKEGETEFFIPYPKRTARDFTTPKKGRFSLDSNFQKNPFASNNLNQNSKKIKFALNLNCSQEYAEHHEQIRKSPAIPFDANKKPLKPLLKPNAISSPINPFYKIHKSKLF